MADRNYSHLNLEDIARLSGVSRSTVSRVVNHHPNVSDRTRQRVMQVIEQYKFSPNPAARALALQRSRVLGVLIPHIVSDLFSDPFFPTLLQGATVQAHTADYSITLWLTGNTTDDQNFYHQALNHRLSDGLIVVSAVLDELLMKRLNESGKPYILVGRPPAGHDEANFVDINNVDGAYLLMRHLIERGYKRIGIIPGREGLTSSQDRLEGYRKALSDAGLPFDRKLVAPSGHYTEGGGYHSMAYLLTQDVDAVFCASDVMAGGAIRAITESGLRVPNDVAVAGFDDIPAAKRTNPPLTTVHQPIQQLGAAAAEGLINLLEGRQEAPYHKLFPVELIVRAST